jgi:hypothetical protein
MSMGIKFGGEMETENWFMQKRSHPVLNENYIKSEGSDNEIDMVV